MALASLNTLKADIDKRLARAEQAKVKGDLDSYKDIVVVLAEVSVRILDNSSLYQTLTSTLSSVLSHTATWY